MEPLQPVSSSLGALDLRPVVVGALRCAACRSTLTDAAPGLHCPRCCVHYPVVDGVPDLRPASEIHRRLDIDVVPPHEGPPLDESTEPIPMVPSPVVDLDDLDHDLGFHHRFGNRLTRPFVSHVPAGSADELFVDLGCGARTTESIAAAAGFTYLPVDYDGDYADVLADAHALPLADESASVVMSIGVLEHLRYPYLATSEIARVLRPGGMFMGTVAFLEPLHEQSHFNHSVNGTRAVLDHAGLEVVHLESNRAWPGVRAILEMAYFPGASRPLGRVLAAIAGAAHRLVQLVRRQDDRTPLRVSAAGGFRFIARKPAP